MDLMTKVEIAQKLRVTTMTIDRYEKNGMPVLRPAGGDPRYDFDAIVEWMKAKPEDKEGQDEKTRKCSY